MGAVTMQRAGAPAINCSKPAATAACREASWH